MTYRETFIMAEKNQIAAPKTVSTTITAIARRIPPAISTMAPKLYHQETR